MATDKIQIGLRVPDELRDQIQMAASQRGVSVNKEITDRLQNTFDEDVRISSNRENDNLYAVLRVVAAAMELAGPSAAVTSTLNPDAMKMWLENPFAYDQSVKAAVAILDALRPPGRGDPHPAGAAIAKLLGLGAAKSVLEEAASGQARTNNPTAIARAKKLNADLGSLAERIQQFNLLTPKRGKRK